MRRWHRLAVGCLAWALAAQAASALQQRIAARLHNYAEAPVVITQAEVRLVEVFSTPTQPALPGANARPSRIRYANRAGQLLSQYLLEGTARCRNQSSQPVEALGLTIVLLDAFHEKIRSSARSGDATHQLVVALPRRAEERITWKQQVESPDVSEVAVVLTRVRFADGTVWQAPKEELVDVF